MFIAYQLHGGQFHFTSSLYSTNAIFTWTDTHTVTEIFEKRVFMYMYVYMHFSSGEKGWVGR